MLSFCLQLRPRASQLPSPFLAISHTIDVILLNIANVFQIWSAPAGFKEIAVGFESFSFCSVQERERVSSTPTGLVWNTNMAAVSLFRNTSMPDMTSCENAILNWREITFRILDFSSLSFAGELVFLALQKIKLEARREASKTELSLNLKRIALEKGFVISDNQGDGNCMFFALSEQLDRIKGIKITHEELRRTVVQHLTDNPRLVSIFF